MQWPECFCPPLRIKCKRQSQAHKWIYERTLKHWFIPELFLDFMGSWPFALFFFCFRVCPLASLSFMFSTLPWRTWTLLRLFPLSLFSPLSFLSLHSPSYWVRWICTSHNCKLLVPLPFYFSLSLCPYLCAFVDSALWRASPFAFLPPFFFLFCEYSTCSLLSIYSTPPDCHTDLTPSSIEEKERERERECSSWCLFLSLDAPF